MSIINQLETQDILTDVLSTLKLTGKIFCCSELSAPWAMDIPQSDFAHFHVIERGSGWLKIKNSGQTISLASGDLVIVTTGSGHIISDSPETAPIALSEILKQKKSGCNQIEFGGGGIKTHLICGSFHFNNLKSNPLLTVLPALIHVRSSQSKMADWLESTLKMLAYEANSSKPGNQTILTRLIDIIFIQAIRAWLEQQSGVAVGWLAALSDHQIGAAIGKMHQMPNQNWSVSSLATQVGMSRSLFAARFTTLVGKPPLSYLTYWRMHLAISILMERKTSVGEVALKVGYESEAAFSKAFKRYFGLSPSFYKKNNESLTSN
jgi:AraC-like DNA-binding protein